MSPASRFPTPEVSLTKHPASLPRAQIDNAIDHNTIARICIGYLRDLSNNSLTENAIWRDSLALTGTFRTFFGPSLVLKVWRALSVEHAATNFTLQDGSSHIVRCGKDYAWIEARFDFDTYGSRSARCSGIIGIAPVDPDQSRWQIWLLCSILEQPNGWPDVDNLEPAEGRSRPARSKKLSEFSSDGKMPNELDCVVVGGGISGLCMAGRLQALDLRYLVLEQRENVGDTWMKERYQSMRLHTPKEYNQLPGPYRMFGPGDPDLLSASDLARVFKAYVEKFDIKIAVSSRLVSASWGPETKSWTLTVRCLNSSVLFRLHTKHIVFACGSTGITPYFPVIPDRHLYKGLALHEHDWKADSHWQGSHGVVVGSANTAQWIISDMTQVPLRSVTMLQRSRTFLLPTRILRQLLDPIYNLDTPTTISDRALLAYPLSIQRLTAMAQIAQFAEQTPAYFDRIISHGYDGERYGDLWGLMYDREGGHFFDLGAGELIANGTVQVRSHVEPVAFTSTGLLLSDGAKIDADIIVFATGYRSSMKDAATEIVGDEIGKSLQEFWQCDAEGEIRGAWKYIGHPGLWYTGHGFAHARYYSRYVSMLIKADVGGSPIEAYTETPID